MSGVLRMREVGCLVPVLVLDGCLRDGHHRVKIAVLLGWTELPVTDREEESGTYATRTVV